MEVGELGFVPFDRTAGELLFNVVTERYEKRSILVTTNLAFTEWPKVFGGDEKLTAALLDRLADHGTVITTKGKSFRLRRSTGLRSAKADEACLLSLALVMSHAADLGKR